MQTRHEHRTALWPQIQSHLNQLWHSNFDQISVCFFENFHEAPTFRLFVIDKVPFQIQLFKTSSTNDFTSGFWKKFDFVHKSRFLSSTPKFFSQLRCSVDQARSGLQSEHLDIFENPSTFWPKNRKIWSKKRFLKLKTTAVDCRFRYNENPWCIPSAPLLECIYRFFLIIKYIRRGACFVRVCSSGLLLEGLWSLFFDVFSKISWVALSLGKGLYCFWFWIVVKSLF